MKLIKAMVLLTSIVFLSACSGGGDTTGCTAGADTSSVSSSASVATETGAGKITERLGVVYKSLGIKSTGYIYTDTSCGSTSIGYSADSADGTASSGAPPSAASGNSNNSDASSLKGGEWNDHDNFDEYLAWAKDYAGAEVHWFDASNRKIIKVHNSNGLSVPNAKVEILGDSGTVIFTAITDGSGEVAFFPNMIQAGQKIARVKVAISKGEWSTQAIKSFQEEDWHFTLRTTAAAQATILEVAFLLDTTGSMSDEIKQLQKTLKSTIEKVNKLDSAVAVRLALVLYRDHGDDYVTQVHQFTDDIDAFQKLIDAVSANAGGDMPEAVNAALQKGIEELQWSDPTAEAVRITFLIGDAPPHLDYQEDVEYLEESLVALQKGIKIFPVAASGLDNGGEYIFRQLSLLTMAKFIFISYDGSTPYSVGAYNENNLDDIIYNVIAEELKLYGSL